MLEQREVRFDEIRQRDVAPAEIRRVVLLDTRQRERLGVVAHWLDAQPSVEVVAYDHHPDSPGDVPITGGIVDPAVGATSTLIAEALRERAIAPTAEEATLLLMGIYEDTGSLSYATTSPRDLAAAAWLLERGGDLEAVRRFALHAPDRVHLDQLHRMGEELEVVRVHGHRVGVVAIELGSFVDELAPLVSRCVELFDLPLLFAIFGEGDRSTIIARGLEGFHPAGAGGVAGGGGHQTAAAGSVKGATAWVREVCCPPRRLQPPARGTRPDDLPLRWRRRAATVAEAKERRCGAAQRRAGAGRRPGGRGAVTRQPRRRPAARPEGRPVTRDATGARGGPPTRAEELAAWWQHPRFVLVGRRPAGRSAWSRGCVWPPARPAGRRRRSRRSGVPGCGTPQGAWVAAETRGGTGSRRRGGRGARAYRLPASWWAASCATPARPR
jgi:nanoRNase/pAp phosphatase (c-di-AMP/oligoRNAs hydrolase)